MRPFHRHLDVVAFLSSLLACLFLLPAPAFAASDFLFMIPPLKDRYFYAPNGLAADGSGNVWVCDAFNHRVLKLDSSGVVTDVIGGYGWGVGKMDRPADVALDANGNIFVSDRNNNRIQKFAPNGSSLAQVGEYGTGDGQFNHPIGLDVLQSTGEIFVVDSRNDRVQRFANDLSFTAVYTNPSEGGFNDPHGLALTSTRFFVSDAWQDPDDYDRVWAFALDGTYDIGIGDTGAPASDLDDPQGVAVIGANQLYIADTSNNRVQRFTDDVYVDTWGGTYGGDPGEFREANGVCVLGTSTLVVSDSFNNRLQLIATDFSGSPTVWDGGSGNGDGEFNVTWDVDVLPNGNIIVIDRFNDRVQIFDDEGTFISTGTFGLSDPTNLVLQSDGAGYITDNSAHTVSKYDSGGSPLFTLGASGGGSGSGNGEFNSPLGLALDSQENLYVADQDNDRVQVFDSSGTFLRAVVGLVSPMDVAIGPGDKLYVAQYSGSKKIAVFDASGTLTDSWGDDGAADGQLIGPWGIAVDPRGIVYVSDRLDRVQAFTPRGRYLYTLGGPGVAAGTFAQPQGLDVGPDNRLYVADSGNHRVQVFSPGPACALVPVHTLLLEE